MTATGQGAASARWVLAAHQQHCGWWRCVACAARESATSLNIRAAHVDWQDSNNSISTTASPVATVSHAAPTCHLQVNPDQRAGDFFGLVTTVAAAVLLVGRAAGGPICSSSIPTAAGLCLLLLMLLLLLRCWLVGRRWLLILLLPLLLVGLNPPFTQVLCFVAAGQRCCLLGCPVRQSDRAAQPSCTH